jgi:hypothetical protein
MRPISAIARFAVAAACLAGTPFTGADDEAAATGIVSIGELPQRLIAKLTPVATLPLGPGNECSGLVASRDQDDLFWSINDSGNEPRIYPIHRNGELYLSADGVASTGVVIQGATNVDWEDVAVDTDGHVIVCDVGNNLNQRRDLTFYLIDEPEPGASEAPIASLLRVRYPDQTEFPPPAEEMNFDCEAVFVAGGKLHLLTKHRGDAFTKLYRLDDPQSDEENVLTFLGGFTSGGPVTAADASADGLRMVFVTYTNIWLFERDDLETPFFESRVSWAPYLSVQVESVCFADDDTLLLVDEKLAMLYELELSELTRVR